MLETQRQTANTDAVNRMFALKAMAAPKRWLGSRTAPRYEIKLKPVSRPVPPAPKLDQAAIRDSAERASRASRDSLSLYYRLHRQGRNDLEYIAWVMFLEASWSADTVNDGPVDHRTAKDLLSSAERGMHLALSLDRILSREGNRCMATARRIYREMSTSALALGKFLNLEVALPD